MKNIVSLIFVRLAGIERDEKKIGPRLSSGSLILAWPTDSSLLSPPTGVISYLYSSSYLVLIPRPILIRLFTAHQNDIHTANTPADFNPRVLCATLGNTLIVNTPADFNPRLYRSELRSHIRDLRSVLTHPSYRRIRIDLSFF